MYRLVLITAAMAIAQVHAQDLAGADGSGDADGSGGDGSGEEPTDPPGGFDWGGDACPFGNGRNSPCRGPCLDAAASVGCCARIQDYCMDAINSDAACRDLPTRTLIRDRGGCDSSRTDLVCSAYDLNIDNCPAGRCVRRNSSSEDGFPGDHTSVDDNANDDTSVNDGDGNDECDLGDGVMGYFCQPTGECIVRSEQGSCIQDVGHGDGGNHGMSCEDVDAEPNCYDIWNQAPCIARPYCAFVNGQCYDRTIDLADMTCSEFTDEDSCAQNANRCSWNYDDGMCGSLPCANFASDVYLCQSQGCDFVQDDIDGDACTDIVRVTPGPDGCGVTQYGCCGTHVDESFGCCPSDPTLSAAGPDGYGCAGYVPSTTTPPPTTTLPPTNPPTNPPTDPPTTASPNTQPTDPPIDPPTTASPTTSPPTAPPTMPITAEPTQATHGYSFSVSFNGDYTGLTDTQMAVFRSTFENEIATRAGVLRSDIYSVELSGTDDTIVAQVIFSGSVPASTVSNTRANVAATPVSLNVTGSSSAFTSDDVTLVDGVPTAAPTAAPTPGPTMGDSDTAGSSSSDDDQGTVLMLIIIIAVIALLGIAIVIVLYNRRKHNATGTGGRTVYQNPAYGSVIPPANLESVELNTFNGTQAKPAPSGMVKVESMC